jgi:NAD(P)H-dependent flavin oxidoreductase YrpB (nitropropane dioxygenase family)
VYRRRLADADETDTVLTRCFDGGWPNAPHRVLRNKTVSAWDAAGRPASPDRPGENDIVAIDRHAGPRRRYHQAIPTIGASGDLAEMALYAGQSAVLTGEPMPAGQIVATIAQEAAGIVAGQRRRATGTTASYQ